MVRSLEEATAAVIGKRPEIKTASQLIEASRQLKLKRRHTPNADRAKDVSRRVHVTFG